MYHKCKFHLQGAKITYEREANLVIDYSSLSRNLKQVRLIHCLFVCLLCLSDCKHCDYELCLL